MPTLFEIRSEDGHVHNRVENPAVVFDKDCGTLHRIGERAEMERYFNTVQHTFRAGGASDMADAIMLMDLPKDQDVIDRVFQSIDYAGVLYRQIQKEMKG